jgi:hypothetical protein
MSAALPLGGDWRYGGPNRDGVITIRVIWIAFALSLLVHIAALWTSPPLVRNLNFDSTDKLRAGATIIAQLAPATRAEETPPPPPSPPARAVPPSRPTPPSQRPAPRPTPAPTPPPPAAPPITRTETIPAPGPAPPPRPTPQPSPPAEATPPPVADLSAYIAARRSERGEPPAPPPVLGGPTAKPGETEKERLNRIVAANLGLNKTPTFGDDPKRGGGLFQMKRMGYDDAEFFFNGWDKDIGRVARQLIEVRKGSNPDIRLAVVRKIIEIIRAQEPGDFVWVSRRMNRMVPLSARPADNAALEDFLMREFFSGEPR